LAIDMTDSLKQKLPIPVRTFAIADPMLWSATPLLFPDAYPARAAGRRTGVVPSVVTPLMAVPPGEDNRPVGGIPRLLALAALGGFDNQAVQRSYATHQVTAGAPPGPAELALAQLTATSLIGETARHDVDAEIGDPHWGLSMAGAARILLVDGTQQHADDEITNSAVHWWNARALRPAVHDQLHRLSLLLPVAALHDQRVIGAVGAMIDALTTSSPAVFLLPGPGVTPTAIDMAREQLRLPLFSGTYCDHTGHSGTPAAVVVGEDPADRWRGVPRLSGQRSSLPAVLAGPRATVRYLPPLQLDQQLQGPAWLRISGRTITGPRRPLVAESHVSAGKGKWDGPGVAVPVSMPAQADIELRLFTTA